MGNNNLYKVENTLRSIAKRYKSVKYSLGLAILFLMMGVSAFSEEVNPVANGVPTREEIATSRENLKNSVGSLHSKIDSARKENEKELNGLRLELIQLMEQGNQVVKSPWASWQFGANYMYSKWNGTYKGKGDKAEKYPYEGIFERDSNLFNRYIPTNSGNYSLLAKSTNPRSAASNSRANLNGYGIASTQPVPEPSVETEVNAGINPKSINKVPLNIAAKVANSPTLPEAVKFAPIDPKIVIPADPDLPEAPKFSVVLGADCNSNCDSHGVPRQRTKDGFLNSPSNKSSQNTTAWLHYTWKSNSGAEKSYAFKMYAEETTADITNPNGTHPPANTKPSGNEYYFNSYNFGNEFPDDVEQSQEGAAGDKNHQRFFIGGSRFWEIDNKNSGTFEFPNGKTLNLGGILTLGLVSQENGTELKNSGTITDVKEKDDAWIKEMTYDGGKDYLTIHGPTGDYQVKRSGEGYVGYKVGIAQVEENDSGTFDHDKQKMTNSSTGKINFFGERSIGMYVYLPEHTTYAIMRNEGEINLRGSESYGMKIAAKSADRAEMVNTSTGKITLGKNGKDSASNSIAMALTADNTVANGVSLKRGNARNEGTITVKDVQNSLGAYVNVDSSITNTSTGKINVNSTIAELTAAEKAANKKQAFNMGMRADSHSGAEIRNEGEITIDGAYAIGMLAKGSRLVNTKTISSTNVKNGIGIVGMNGATVENSGTIKVVGTGNTNNIGILINSGSTGTVGAVPPGNPAPSVEVSGDNSTGALVTGAGSSLTMKGNVTVSGNSITGIVANGTTVKLEGDATVKVDNNGAEAGEINKKGSYGIVVKGSAGKFEGKDTTVNTKVTTDKSIGLYSEGELTVKKANVTATDGAINFFAKDGKININGGGTTITGQKSLLFYTSGSGKVTLGGAMTATIKGGTTPSTRGTAFYYVSPTRYGAFNTAAIQNYFNNTFGNGASTLNHLTLNMEQGSRLFVASNVGMNLSDTSATNLMSGITNAPTINGSNYKTFMLYLSKLTINQAVDLNNSNSNYAQLEIANSSIENANNMTGSQNRQVAMAQENGNDTTGAGYESKEVTLTNTATGVINLTGEETTGIYAKRGRITNAGKISVGKKSTGIYLVEDDRSPAAATVGATATNDASGVITVGENSTGIYYKVKNDNADGKGTNTGVSGGISNDGRIESTAKDVIAMSFDSPYSSKTVKNEQTGVIDLQGQNSTGIFATGTGTYTAKNDGKIKLASSTNVNTPNIGMYTDKSGITLESNGTIEGGDKTVGMYGYGINLQSNAITKVGAGGTGVYSKGGNVTVNGGTLSVGENGAEGSNDAVGVYYVGAGGTVTNNAANVNIGNSAYGFVVQNENGAAVTLKTSTPNVTLRNDAVYAYSNNRAGSVTNTSVLNSAGNGNYGIYSAGTVTNNGNINFGTGIGNVGVYSILGGTATNNARITVGASDAAAEKFGIGMAAGYKSSDSGNIINSSSGIINVTGKNSIGMYATGPLSTATNKGTINLSGENSVGMYLDNGATGINEGTITTVGSPKGAKGVVLSNNSKLINRAGAKININSAEGFGIYRVNSKETNITVVNYGDITVGGGATAHGEYDPTGGKPLEKTAGGVSLKSPKGTNDINITVNGKPVPNVEKVTNPIGHRGDALISSLGMYVDTLRGTNPINGLNKLNVKKAELLYGVEAAQNSNSKYFEVSGKILKPYQDAVRNASGIKWSHNSAAFTWMALPTVDSNGVPLKVGMAKIPYTEFAGKEPMPVEVSDTYNFLDGLEQRYDKNALDSREKLLFNKLNGIGNNESVLFYQATDEMMGHQYANVQQRINATGNILNKEFDYLRSEWQTVSKDSNKVKVFGTRGEYKTDTAGVIDYKNHAYGVAYVHENEDIKLGRGIGWYAGMVHNTFRFKDIGNSKERQLQGKVGLFKSVPFDDNNSLNWTISGDIFIGHNKMHRKFLVVDDIFNAKARYYTYGIGIKNELGKEFRLSESFTLRPYVALGLEYGRVSKIREKSGEIKLEVKQNHYISVKPEVGAELAFKHYFGRKTFKVGLGVAYENELGRVAKGKNKARVADTNADWFNIRSEKDDRKGNVKFDLNLGLDNQRYGVTANVGYDTKGENIRGGLGLRVIF
ncbi:autotransporter-associated N-terminal domain-containing protein [Fusobacterium nucleatum]|uniref:Autotransporter-associated N-terminal domain-containing protein n=1 Tax=Fusobacterium nucleatum TaxID=851 RepID=A0AAX3MCQ9_FUSNU|nr:autotransporter-associated N-terminal domain-containing protein [Fusobacterium nucleatum]WDA44504.1 autotransporter-associated N-terminal domain-containing protein [Fusobacterium nucleatum]